LSEEQSIRTLLLLAVLTLGWAQAQQWEFERIDSGPANDVEIRLTSSGAPCVRYTAYDYSTTIATEDSGWHKTVVDPTVTAGASGGISFALGPDDRFGLALASNTHVRFAEGDSAAWRAETVAVTTGGYQGLPHPQLAYAPDSTPHIFYGCTGYDAPGGLLMADRTDSSWVVDTALWNVPQFPYAAIFHTAALEFDSLGRAYALAYFGWGVADLDPPWSWAAKLWQRDSAGWSARQLGGGTSACALDLCIGLGGLPHTVYQWAYYSTSATYCDAEAITGQGVSDAAVAQNPSGQLLVAYVVCKHALLCLPDRLLARRGDSGFRCGQRMRHGGRFTWGPADSLPEV
jgi:hypothetical protein